MTERLCEENGEPGGEKSCFAITKRCTHRTGRRRRTQCKNDEPVDDDDRGRWDLG